MFPAPDPLNSEPISKLGDDAFTSLPELEAFSALMLAQARPVKAALLDQSVLSGIGNWIADEVLYQARIFPGDRGQDLQESQLRCLHSAIRSVLEKAVSVDADAEQLPRDWLFHYRCASVAST